MAIKSFATYSWELSANNICRKAPHVLNYGQIHSLGREDLLVENEW